MTISNYRSVSLLSVFGFNKKHSTSMALSILVDKIISTIDKGRNIMGLFLDFSKAFDTVNHRILLNKFDKYYIDGVGNTWINSYLTNRKEFV